VQLPQIHNGTKFHSGSYSAVTRASTEPLAREIRPMAESIGFGVTAVSRLSARNTIRQEDSGLLCLPCPALPCARKAHLPGSQFRAATCLFEASSYRPFPPPLLLLIARSNHRLPHETVSRPVDWTTYGSDSFRFSHPILPIKMERAQIPFLFHLWREYRSDDILDGILDVSRFLHES